MSVTELAGFNDLPPPWRGLLVFLELSHADDSLYVTIVQGKEVEDQIIFLYYAYGGNRRKVSRMLHVSPKRVHRAVDIFLEEQVIPRSLPIGRPKKVNPVIVANIKAQVLANHRISIAQIQQKLLTQGQSLSHGAIDQILHQPKFEYKPPKVRQKLTEVQVQKRLKFVVSMKAGDWLNLPIIFSDESRFSLTSDGQWAWRRRGDTQYSAFEDEQKYPRSVMVWGHLGRVFGHV